MDYEDIYLIINFETDDIAEQMVREEPYPTVSEEQHVINLLAEEKLSFSVLEGSFATMQNVNKKLFIQLDTNNTIYRPSLLELLDLKIYIDYANTFLQPKKVHITDVSSQVGGIIDTNYGIKFKIKLTDNVVENIDMNEGEDTNIHYKHVVEDSTGEEYYHSEVKQFISTALVTTEIKDVLREIGLREENATDKTINTIKNMVPFFHSMHDNINKDRDDIEEYKQIFSDRDLYFVGCYGEFYCIAFVGLYYVVYTVENNKVVLLPIKEPNSLWKLSKLLKAYAKER